MTHLNRILKTNLDILFSSHRGIRDGNTDAIHDARVATRRLRAVLPLALAGLSEDQSSRAAKTMRRVGRALGRAREVDVSLEQLDGAELRIPSASRAVSLLRLKLIDRRNKERRRLIKRLEQNPLQVLKDMITTRPRAIRFVLRSDPQARILSAMTAGSAERLGDAVEAAGGVYFPKRSHAVRIAAKKLRYLMELAPNAENRKAELKSLKRVQEILGKLHDRQTVLDLIERERMNGPAAEDFDALAAWVRADIGQLQEQYLRHRDELTSITDRLLADVRNRAAASTSLWIAAGAFAAPSALAFVARRLRQQKPEDIPVVSATDREAISAVR